VNRIKTTARLLAAAGLASLTLGALAAGPVAARAATAGATGSAAAASCPTGATCVTIPANCPAGTTCPTVDVEPSTDIGQGQWVYLNLFNFPANSTADIYFCSDKSPITTTKPPYCVLEGSANLTYPSQQLPIGPDGTAATSFQTEADPNANGDPALFGQIPGDTQAPSKSFFCGDAADPCSIDVLDWTLLGSPLPPNFAVPVPSDTAVVPVGFAPSSNGCPKATPVFTYSDYSIDKLLPHESPVACKDANPAIALDVPHDTAQTLSALSSGGLPTNAVAFIDDPQAADVQTALAGLHYAVIPIIASAVVVGYTASMQQNGINYPFHAFKLTPNDVAGLVAYNYQGPYDADMVACPGGTCSALEELNSVPRFVAAGEYGGFVPSLTSGVTEALTGWFCHAPNLPFVANGKLIHDPNTAQQTFTTSFDKNWPIKTCSTFDQMPAIQPVGTLWALETTPDQQDKYLRTFAPPAQFQGSPLAGFAPMDWGDARYYGLDSASLQNAAGQFVAPSVASVQAEVAAEPIAKAGYATPAPTLAVKGGYPMSTVIDALIPDSPLAPSVSKPISEMVNELLNYTTTAASLPDGYVPLPPKLAALAHTELAAALKAENAPVTATTTTTASVSSHSVTFGASVTYEATVAATSGTPTGTVEFDIGSKVLCKAVLSGATASCSSAAAPTGKDTIKANYLGTTGFASSSATATLEVSPATVPTTTAPTTTVPTTTMPPTTVPTSTLPPTTVPPTTAPVTTVPAKKPSSGNLSIADVTLSSTAAEGALPATLAVGGSLIALSLGFTFLGTIRRRRSGGNARA